MHVIAGKAVAFGEGSSAEFKLYAKQVVENAKALADTIISGGYDITSGGTDNHLMLVDLRAKELTGKAAEAALTRAGITCNKNGVPFDPQKPTITSFRHPPRHSGRDLPRLRRRRVQEGRRVDRASSRRVPRPAPRRRGGRRGRRGEAKSEVHALTDRFPIYG